MPSHDVVIAGAGPSGSLAALVLARAGHHVALLDRAAFPRAKVCGNCLNPAVGKIWEQLGLADSFAALPHREMVGFTIEADGGMLYRETFVPPRHGPRVVARDLFDDWLRCQAMRAGAEFFPGTAVSGLDAAAGIVDTSAGTFSAQLVLGADGRNSVVARLSGALPAPRRCHRVAWQASLPAPETLGDEVRMRLFPEGYFGLCRFNAREAVLSGVLDARRSQDPLPVLRRWLPDLPEQEWMRLNPITRAPARLVPGRVWLLGDAARVVEPFTGEGIYFALRSALLAAEAAREGFARGDFPAAFRRYTRAHRELYRRRAWVNTLTRWLLAKPDRTARLWQTLRPPRTLVSFLSGRVHAV